MEIGHNLMIVLNTLIVSSAIVITLIFAFGGLNCGD